MTQLPLPTLPEIEDYCRNKLWWDLKTMEDVDRISKLEQRTKRWFDYKEYTFSGSLIADLVAGGARRQDKLLRMLYPQVQQPNPYANDHIDMGNHGTLREFITETVLVCHLQQFFATTNVLPPYLKNDVDWTRLQILHPGLVMSLEYKGLGISPDGVLLVPRISVPNDYVVCCLEYKNRPPLPSTFQLPQASAHRSEPFYKEGVKHYWQVLAQLEIIKPWIKHYLATRHCTATFNCLHAFYVVGGTHQTSINLVAADPTRIRKTFAILEKLYMTQFVPLKMLITQGILQYPCVTLPISEESLLDDIMDTDDFVLSQ